MTTGFIIAILATAFWSATNLIDKFLVSRFCRGGDVGALLLLSALFPVVLLPIAYVLGDGSLFLERSQIGALLMSGIVTVCWTYFYLKALHEDDVSVVMPLFQLTPLFAFAFAFFALSELPTTQQLAYGAIIVAGSFVLTVERTSKTFKYRLIFLVLSGSALIALMNTLFKFAARDADFWIAIFWQATGTFLAGLLLFALYQPFRHELQLFLKANWGIGISLNGLNEALVLIGNVLFAYAILLAPLALVQTTEAYQPIFVFITSIILAFLFPGLIQEDLSRGAVFQKTLGITIVVLGSYLLLSV